jgi:hypothetical protein
MSNINLLAPIIPGTSAGGYIIGTSISSLGELDSAILIDSIGQSVSKQLSISEGWACLEAQSKEEKLCYRKTYYYKNDLVRLQFNSRGILYCIYLSNGYRGTAFDKIGIESKLSDVKDLFEIDYDSGDDMYYPDEKSGVEGISFYIDEVFAEDENIDIKKSQVLVICVHNWSFASG